MQHKKLGEGGTANPRHKHYLQLARHACECCEGVVCRNALGLGDFGQQGRLKAGVDVSEERGKSKGLKKSK